MPVENKRMTAVKTDAHSINKGMFVKQDGFNPSYVLTKSGQKLSRVRIMATITDKFISADSKFGAVTLDDSTGTIRIKAFKSLLPIMPLNKGDIVDVIGKIKMYNEEIYINPETIFNVQDPNLILLRKAELVSQKEESNKKRRIINENKNKVTDFEELKKLMKKKYDINPEEVESVILSEEMPKTAEEKEETKENEKTTIIKLIESLDKGNGCEYSLLIKESGLNENAIEEIINEILSDGICFEPRPGVIKLL